MARENRKATTGGGTAEQIVSGAIGAAGALTVAVEEIGSELGSAVVRAARGSIKAAEDIGSDLVTVGKDVSRGVALPMRQVGTGITRLTWGRRDGKGEDGMRKMPAKAAGRRRRRPAA